MSDHSEKSSGSDRGIHGPHRPGNNPAIDKGRDEIEELLTALMKQILQFVALQDC